MFLRGSWMLKKQRQEGRFKARVLILLREGLSLEDAEAIARRLEQLTAAYFRETRGSSP